MNTNQTTDLYTNVNNGSVVCTKHLGAEATAAFAQKPKAKNVVTTFGKIARMNQTEIIEWLELASKIYPTGCESCPR